MKNLSITTLIILLSFVSTGCNPESHPRRDRKARGLALRNAAISQSITDDLTSLKNGSDEQFAALQSQINQLKLVVDQLVGKQIETDAKLDELTVELATKCEELTTSQEETETVIEELTVLLDGLSRDDDENTLILTGLNLRIRDAESGPQVPGSGNLLIGRDNSELFEEFYGREPLRNGSNNLIIGGANEYSGSGGLCAGVLNLLNGDNSVVFICENEVRAEFSAVLGGTNCLSQGRFSTVGGGRNRTASGRFDFRAGNLFSDE